MKHPVLKLIGGIALLTILFVAFTVSMFYYVEASVGSENEKFGALKIESLTQSTGLIIQNLENNIQDLENRALISARLEALALRERGDEEGVRVTGDDSMVLRVQNGRVVYPEGGIARLADYDPSLFSDSATVKVGTIRFNAS